MDSLKRLLAAVLLCVAQVLILNNIHLLGYATPLLYIYIVLLFPRDSPRWAMLLWAFAIGLVVDTFSNTPGVAAATMTLLAMLRPALLEPFVPRDSEPTLTPGYHSLGVGRFICYVTLASLLYCMVFFALAIFDTAALMQWLRCTAGSTVLTAALLLALVSAARR